MKQTDLLQFYPEDSHVNLSVLQETDREAMMIDGYGLNTTGLSESPIRNGLLSKIVLDYIRYLNGNNCSLTWDHRVTRYNVTLYQLPMSAHRMKENGQSLLPTPCASDWKRSKVSPKDIIDRHSQGLPVFAAMLTAGEIKLPTPVASQNWKPIRPLSPSEVGGARNCSNWDDWKTIAVPGWEKNPSKICRMDDGISRRLDKYRLQALGNAVVPRVFYPFFRAIRTIEERG